MSIRLPLAVVSLSLLVLAGCAETRSADDTSDSGASKSEKAVAAAGDASKPAESGPGAPRKVRRDQTLGGVKPASDDTLLLYYGDDPDTLNVLTSNDTVSREFQMQVYDSLGEQKFSNPDEWIPSLAESWEFNREKLEYTFHLRKGVKWHPMALPNGKMLPRKEFTAKDVKFTFDCILNKNVEAASLRSYYEDPEAKDEANKYKIKVTIVDDYTVKVRWSKPYFKADEFTLGIQIIPRHVYSVDDQGQPISFDFQSKEFADGFNNHWANTRMCGTGPLIFKEWKKEERAVLERNPEFWGEPFYFSKVIYRHISNPNTALQQILQNDLDWAVIPEKDHYIQSKEHANVVSGKVVLEEYAYPGYRYLAYNQSRELFKDKRVRWAIGHAIPIDTIIDKIYHNLATRLTGPFLPGSSASDDSLKPLSFDLDEANRLLDEAGWKDTDQDGIRDKEINGKKVAAEFDMMIYSDSPQYLSIAQIIKENCRRIGVEVQISQTKWALMLQKLRKKEFDATILGWAMEWKSDPFQVWHGSQADMPDSSNSIGYKNPQVDELIEKLRVTLDPAEQSELFHAIHRCIYDDQPYTFLFRDKRTAGRHGRIQNVKFYEIRPGYDAREWHATTPRVLGQ